MQASCEPSGSLKDGWGVKKRVSEEWVGQQEKDLCGLDEAAAAAVQAGSNLFGVKDFYLKKKVIGP